MSDEPLKILDGLLGRTRGAYFEGDICSVLLSSPFIVRGFEFALADLGIDCTTQYNPNDCYADRFWDVDNRQYNPEESSEIATVDVKSTMTDHHFITTVGQRRRVTAFICVNAGDPSYVDFVPNFFQDQDAVNTPELSPDESLRATVTLYRASRLPASAYGMLNPCTSPYRMPLRLLPEAIRLARAHVRGEGVYQNPWTLVSFPEWKPLTVTRTDYLKPTGKGHRSACDAAMDIYQAARYQPGGSLKIDFVGLQPRLADFKLQLNNGPQRFIQHKQEGRVRGSEALLTEVPITRSGGKTIGWYFSQLDRFDFLFFQFEFSQLPNPVNRVEFFFIPERLIPDSWYSSDSEHANFETEALKEYRFHKDEDGDWLGNLEEVMRQNPNPRKVGSRPARAAVADVPDMLDDNGEDLQPLVPRPSSTFGRSLYATLMKNEPHSPPADSRFLRGSGSGILVCLPRTSSSGDFGYVRYKWSGPEQALWRKYLRPPQFLHTLPAGMEMILLTHYTQYQECSYQGPLLTASEFCRINASKDNQLLIWDVGGADTTLLLVVPSVDIRPTEAQREVFRSNFGLKGNEWRDNTPSLSSLLCTGLLAAEYAVGNDAFSPGCCWDKVWRMLEGFAMGQVEHPSGYVRPSEEYRFTLSHVLSRLVDEHYLRSRTGWTPGEGIDDDGGDDNDDDNADAP